MSARHRPRKTTNTHAETFCGLRLTMRLDSDDTTFDSERVTCEACKKEMESERTARNVRLEEETKQWLEVERLIVAGRDEEAVQLARKLIAEPPRLSASHRVLAMLEPILRNFIHLRRKLELGALSQYGAEGTACGAQFPAEETTKDTTRVTCHACLAAIGRLTRTEADQ